MPLGDSITRGSSSGTPNDPQYYISYRRDLYQGLTDKGYQVDFVGSQRSDGSYYTDFDRDHEGWPGKRDEYIAQNIYTWLTNNPADIILLHIGTNDMNPASPDTNAAGVEQILKEIDRFDPGIWVLVARIIQRVPYDPNTAAYNNNVNSMLDAHINAGDKILKVDMESGAGIVYADQPAGDMYDDKHPYATGYAKMAAKWEQALEQLVVCRWIAFLQVVDNKASH
jgi:lysophospholipase L1-like esterase